MVEEIRSRLSRRVYKLGMEYAVFLCDEYVAGRVDGRSVLKSIAISWQSQPCI